MLGSTARISFLGIIPALASCGFGALVSPGMPCDSSPEAKLLCEHEHVQNPRLHDEIAKLSLERQYKIHRLMMTRIRPPYAGAQKYLVARGKPALDYVLDRAGESRDKNEIKDACLIFRSMAVESVHPVCEDKEAMDKIKILGECSWLLRFCEQD